MDRIKRLLVSMGGATMAQQVMDKPNFYYSQFFIFEIIKL
jgi:hypothetical protein